MSELTIYANLDTSRVEAKEADWKGRIRLLNDELSAAERHALIVTRRVFSAVSSTVSTIRTMLQAFGIALPPAWDAIIGAISSTIMALTSIAAAYTAGGVTAYLAIPVEAAAITLSIFSLGLALQGQAEASRKLDQAELALRSLGGTATAWQRVFGE